MDTWSNPSPFAQAAESPLAKADWSNYFTDKLPSTGWWTDMPSSYSYGADFGGQFDYDPGSVGQNYGPISGLTNRVIDADIDTWLRREHPELFDFTSGVVPGGVAGAGKVGVNLRPGVKLGYFTPDADMEIQNAANKYGIPANFLKAIIHKESSGNWEANSTPVAVGTRGGKRIHGYVGVFEDAAASWGFNFDSLIGNRAGQIEMLASGLRGFYDKLHAQNPQYGWLNVAAYHYSGDPSGASTPSDSYQHGTAQDYMSETEMIWKGLDSDAGNVWSNYTSTGQNTGIGAPKSEDWARYSQYDQASLGLATSTGAPANLVKAVLRYGDEAGLGYSQAYDTKFTAQIQAITNNYRTTGDWDKAIAATFGVATNSPQFARIEAYWDQLNADMSGVFTGTPTTGSNGVVGNQFEAVWGGVPYGVSQEANEVNDFVLSHPSWYDYSIGLLGHLAHPGMDITFPRGTKLYTPVSGTVIIAGGTTSYSFYGNGSPQVGQLRIKLDNGDELILGHMMNITVHAGDRVTPGMQVGVSGGDGTGDHLHLEYRTPSNQFSSGWTSVDPKIALGGAFTGFHQGAQTGLGYTQPLTFQALMRAGASGAPIPSGAVYSQGGGNSSWTSWLRKTMLGQATQDNRAGQLNYANLYNIGGGGLPTGGV